MKKLIIALLMITVFTSCTKSQDDNLKNWSTVQYNYTAGPLPPPYHYSYEVKINKDGVSTMVYNIGYDNSISLNYDFVVSKEDLIRLEEKVNCSKLATGKIESVPENVHPVGGSLEKARIIITNPDPNLDQPPVMIEAPYFPKEEFKEGLTDLYAFINKLVPQDVWMEVNGKKTEYESNYKK